jgi:hypothetical protein
MRIQIHSALRLLPVVKFLIQIYGLLSSDRATFDAFQRRNPPWRLQVLSANGLDCVYLADLDTLHLLIICLFSSVYMYE